MGSPVVQDSPDQAFGSHGRPLRVIEGERQKLGESKSEDEVPAEVEEP